MKIVLWNAFHLESKQIVDDYISYVRKHAEGHDFVVCNSIESIKREIEDADVMVGWGITPEVFAHAKKLKWIQFGSAGIDHTVFPELLKSDVILTTQSGIHVVPVSEHVIAMMLTLTRKLNLAEELQKAHKYDRSELAATSNELFGKTICIIGLGKIGLGIAKLAKAFGMKVIGTKRTVNGSLPNVDEVYASTDLSEILPVSDFVVLVVPLTKETNAILDRDEIAKMKNGAYLINVARGIMVDHDALRDALISGKLGGAALDVFPKEPIQSDSYIYDFPNTIITPHTAASTPNYSERAAAIFKTNLDAFVNGTKMINIYDKNKGY